MSYGVKFYSYFDSSGYGSSGLAYLRGLLNAGWQVHWVPLAYNGKHFVPLQPTDTPPLLNLARDDTALQDLSAIRAATSRPLDYSTVFAHTGPDQWPQFFEGGKRNVGYTTWEADALPPHWKPWLDLADAICVPCQLNEQTFSKAYLRPPVHVIPHIRRHAWNDFTVTELNAMRASLGIPPDHFIFYSINSWDPRKNNIGLLRSYLEAFSADSPVTLILKTSEQGYGAAPFYPWQDTSALANDAIADITSASGGAQAQICLLPYELSGRGIDMLHALGDCYVSASRGEGWGMGIFDAATRGTPVLATGWGGQLDYLGSDWPGAIPFSMRAVPVWPPSAPLFWPPQRWAEPDFEGMVKAWQNAMTDAQHRRTAAQAIAADIANRFAEPVITAQLGAVLHA
ncbi:glycosyltransferase family 4 protein [Ottowia thiooxydans]|uniref:glycosyltransferase family 4 protein n=1 Tax=Ottowia thiooxydans TaxID=219182 RepID=UPI00040672C5|nr:glycosyltransferase family 4 protein [Ottowia thiooxydans]